MADAIKFSLVTRCVVLRHVFFSFLTSEASRTSSTQTSPPVAKRSLNASHVHTCSSVVFVGRREASKVGSLDATLQV